jgi:hypothetical protein
MPRMPKNWKHLSKKFHALRYNLQIDLFDVWGIDFMGPFKIHMDMSIS